MSVHLVQCAAALPLKPGEKLVLLCLAENANARDARAFPGLDALMTWSGLSRARVFEILKTLGELRLVEQVGAGHRGRAAEFVVFPYGCCTAHGREEFGSAGPDASDLTEGSGRPDAFGSCGQSDRPDPIGRKGSSVDGERVQSHAQAKGPAHRTPTKYSPNNQTPGLSPTSTTSPGRAAPEDVVSLLSRLAKNDDQAVSA